MTQRIQTLFAYQIPPSPERAIAVAVIRQAVADVATHVARHGQVWEQASYATDARDFLTNRLWEPGNHWGEILADELTPRMKYQLQEFCDGLRIRAASQGQRLKRPAGTPPQRQVRSMATATVVEDDDE